MANVAHATLTGADLHEPKGIGTASSGTVYVANGSGSGSWSAATTIFGITGMIADFATPVPPTGWLECDGSAQLISSFPNLYAAQTIQQNGARTNGSPTITGMANVGAIGTGYFVAGTGIPVGATVVSIGVNSITISTPCTSSGTSNVIVSPWGLGNGITTFNLPNVVGNSRYRRSRGGLSGNMGTIQIDGIGSHTHTLASFTGTVTGGTDNSAGGALSHSHAATGLTASTTVTSVSVNAAATGITSGALVNALNDQTVGAAGTGGSITAAKFSGAVTSQPVSVTDTVHSHTASGTASTTMGGSTAAVDLIHSHSITGQPVTMSSGATAANGGAVTDTHPHTLVVLTCIKT